MAAAARAAVSNMNHQVAKAKTDEELLAELRLESERDAAEGGGATLTGAAADLASHPYLRLAEAMQTLTVGRHAEPFSLGIMGCIVVAGVLVGLQASSARLDETRRDETRRKSAVILATSDAGAVVADRVRACVGHRCSTLVCVCVRARGAVRSTCARASCGGFWWRQTYPRFSNDPVVDAIDYTILAVFATECVVKIVAEGRAPHRFFVGPERAWNCFDFVIVVACLPIWGLDGGGSVKLLRLMRLARLMKLVKRIPQLYIIVKVTVAKQAPAGSTRLSQSSATRVLLIPKLIYIYI